MAFFRRVHRDQGLLDAEWEALYRIEQIHAVYRQAREALRAVSYKDQPLWLRWYPGCPFELEG